MADYSPLNVLLIEDDPGEARLVGLMLTRIGGYELAQTGLLDTALKLIAENTFDAVLLDLSLPDASGLDLVQRLCATAGDVPVLVMTCFDDDQMPIRTISAGAQDYLVKGKVDGYWLDRAIRFAIERLHVQKDVETEHEKEQCELESALDLQQRLTGWQDSSITARLAGVGPLSARSPDVFAILQSQYVSILDEYIDAISAALPPPRRDIQEIAARIGNQGCGPRDVIDIHLRTVEQQGNRTNPVRARAYAVEGRLLALELMGYLVDYYRMGRKQRNFQVENEKAGG